MNMSRSPDLAAAKDSPNLHTHPPIFFVFAFPTLVHVWGGTETQTRRPYLAQHEEDQIAHCQYLDSLSAMRVTATDLVPSLLGTPVPLTSRTPNRTSVVSMLLCVAAGTDPAALVARGAGAHGVLDPSF